MEFNEEMSKKYVTNYFREQKFTEGEDKKINDSKSLEEE